VLYKCQEKVLDVFPPQLLDFSVDDLPVSCQETLKEASACHAAGAYRAAAMMVLGFSKDMPDTTRPVPIYIEESRH